MVLRFKNSRTRNVEPFTPRRGNEVTIYSCGPTVYSYQHLGNMRSYWFGSLLQRAMEWNGYDVKQVINITDVGHIVGDGDVGEDKLERQAKREGRSALDIADFYLKQYWEDFAALGYRQPYKWTRATDYIDKMIEFASALEVKGFTYKIPSGLYFDTSKFPGYGELANVDLDSLEEGKRIGMVEGRRNASDFAVWRSYATDDPRVLVYQSPWGDGTPGWHLECSTMAIDELGPDIDIHSGGIDHLNIHHNDEIAQSTAYLGRDHLTQPWVNFWLHHEFVNFGGRKVSKSAGDSIRVKDLTDNGIFPEAYVLFLDNAHYSKPVDLTLETLSQWQRGLVNAARTWAKLVDSTVELQRTSYDEIYQRLSTETAKAFVDEVHDSFSDDLGVPRVRASFDQLTKGVVDGSLDISTADLQLLHAVAEQLLGLDFLNVASRLETETAREQLAEDSLPGEAQALAASRREARNANEYAQADVYKAQLLERFGLIPIDTKDGTIWERVDSR